MPPQTTLPQIAPISTGGAAAPDISSILNTVAPETQSQHPTVPMTVTGTSSSPVINPILQKAPVQMQNPVAGTEMDKERARKHNNFAQITNALNQFAQQKQMEKQNNLTNEIGTVMKAQQQIDNANAVLANDPNNANAKAVLEQNKRVIEAKFNDKKIANDLKKAFDISFTDPKKNNTPEVQAMKAATAQVKAATAAGIDHNTPQEKEVAQQAANGGKTPAQVAVNNDAAKAAAPAQSATPYADQFLKGQIATISPNPMYLEQIKQAVDREKWAMQYVIPKAIDAYSKYQDEELKQGRLDARVQYAGTMAYLRQSRDLISKEGIASDKNKNALMVQDRKNAAAMARLEKTLNAQLGVYNAKGIKGTPYAKAVADKAIASIDAQIKSIVDNNTELTNQQSANRYTKEDAPKGKHAGDVIDQSKEDQIRNIIDHNNLAIDQFTNHRQKALTEFYGKPMTGSYTPNTAGYVTPMPTKSGASTPNTVVHTIKTGDKNGGATSGTTAKVVGADESDESDADSDAETQAIIKGFDIEDQ